MRILTSFCKYVREEIQSYDNLNSYRRIDQWYCFELSSIILELNSKYITYMSNIQNI